MALALFADEDYEEVAARLAGTLAGWDCWDGVWAVPTSGGMTQARQRLGSEPLVGLFGRVAVPVASELTRGAFLGPWRLMAIDGFEWDVPDTAENATEFGYPAVGGAWRRSRRRGWSTVASAASHAWWRPRSGRSRQAGEQTLAAAAVWRGSAPDWLVLADRNFYSFRPGRLRRRLGRSCCGG